MASFSCSGNEQAISTAIESLITPRYNLNFSPASSRDALVFGVERPGHVHPNIDTPRTPRGPDISTTVVQEWCKIIKDKGIQRVLCLLHKEELSFYQEDLLKQLKSHFTNVQHIDPTDNEILKKILLALKGAEESKEAIVIMCASGQERTGNLLALWLHHRYNLSVDEAVNEVEEFSIKCGSRRKPTTEGVVRLLAPSQKLVPPLRTKIAFATPRLGTSSMTSRSKSTLHISFVQMGGTIDKNITEEEGFAFEIGEPAVTFILPKINPNFAYDIITVCRKDCRNISNDDRIILHQTLLQSESEKFIVTHGLTSILETAKFIQKIGGLEDKLVIFTGSSKPARFSDSDAIFNIGTSVGALNILRRGVYICMNGRTYESEKCVRDPTTGFFVGETLTRPGMNRPGSSNNNNNNASSTSNIVVSDDDGEEEMLSVREIESEVKPSPIVSSMKKLNLTKDKERERDKERDGKIISAPSSSLVKKSALTGSIVSKEKSPRTLGTGGSPSTKKALRARKSSSEKKSV